MSFHINQQPPPVVQDPDTTPEIEELYSAWALTILCGLLILSLWTSYYVQIKRIRAVHETVLSIFAGMVVGLVVRMLLGHLIREMLTFKHTLFFNLLLPPIILNSGYELKQENFFRNFGSILTFAFLGTFISAIGIGVLMYLYSFLALESLSLTLLECLIFGSTLSATDPVTILAIFNQYKVDPKLYAVIFGESILNDAVSIVMYETLSQFHGTDIYISSLFNGVGIFFVSFFGSMGLGVSFGLSCSLILKHSSLHLYPGIESCIVALIAYTSYFFSNGIHMSGIVSLLFCGITLKHYAYHIMSRRTQRTTKYMFSVLAQLSENFIFIYLGLNLFTQDVQVFKPLFIMVATIAVIATRYGAVFSLSEIINLFYRARGRRQEELPHSYQMMLFWAGLRGAVGVALAAGFQGENAPALRTTVLVVVVLTVIVFGGTTARMLEVVGIRTGVEEGGDGDSSDEEGPREWSSPTSNGVRRGGRRWNAGVYGWDRSRVQLDNYVDGRTRPSRVPLGGLDREGRAFSAASSENSDSGEVLPRETDLPEGQHLPADKKWFTALDERYLLPLFSNSVASRQFHARRARRMPNGGGSGQDSRADSPVDGVSDEESREHDLLLREPRDRRGQDFTGSMGDFFRSIRGGESGERAGGEATGGTSPGGAGGNRSSQSLPGSPLAETTARLGFRGNGGSGTR